MSNILDRNMNFDNIFWITTTAMRLNRSHPYIVRDKKWLMLFSTFIILTLMCCFFLLHSIFLHEIPCGEYAAASKNGIMVIVAFLFTYKYFILLRYQESITNLIRIMDKDYELAKGFCDEEQRIVYHYSMRGFKVCQYWCLSACLTGAIFPVKAFLLMGKSYMAGDFKLIQMFDMTYPWILNDYKNVHIIFVMLFTITLLFDVYATLMLIGFDPIVPIFILHLCGRIDILSLRMSKILSNPQDSAVTVQENLREIIVQMQDIYKFVEIIKTNFTVIYEFIMKTTTFVLPLTAFQLTESLHNGEINVEFFSFFSASLLHFYLPSYYSDLLMETGEKFRLAIYSCGWEKHSDLRVRCTILIMLTRTVKPIVISTIFRTLSLDSFSEMCREAFSIYNLVNAVCA